ncbi:MAG: acyl-CoA thioesterase [Planctomycetales bacterium]|nr:acyl-CoA thioesterase [Planctomycetales bacterium]
MQHEIEIRVRYQETDGQGRVHHANYLTYFEQGRVELLRSMGRDYADMERDGLFLVVAEMRVRYFGGALFDDVLRLTTRVERVRGVRIEHAYELRRGEELLAEGTSTIACVDRTGRVRPLPAWLRTGS